jgi:transcriptional regulator with XRE-family HTH domain
MTSASPLRAPSSPNKKVAHTAQERLEVERFVRALQQAMAVHQLSQRDLSARIGIQIGTMTKYLRGDVAPLRVATGIQSALARVLGVTTDALVAYYRCGEYATAIDCADVVSWIRSDALQADLPALLEALREAGQRWMGELPPPVTLAPYLWPIEELKEAGLSDKFRQRLGLTDEALKRLATSGEFDEELAEAFSVACNYELGAVLEAFQNRRPIA